VPKKAKQTKLTSRKSSTVVSKKTTLPPTVSRASLMLDGSDALVRRITHLHYVLSGMLESIRGGFASLIGVSSFQYVLMQALGRLQTDTDWTVRSVAREMHMTDAYVSTEISDLEQQGFLEKVTNPNDRRMSFLSLTAKGRESLAAIAPIQTIVNDTLYGHLDEKSATAYLEELGTLAAQAEKASAVLDQITAAQRLAVLGNVPRPRRRRRPPLRA
jgi:MarR family transcriptional regulator, organic hydroperoxide resistance regulator